MSKTRIGRTVGIAVGATAGTVGLLASVGTMMALRRPLPRTSGKVKLEGLDSTVDVLRDQWGVPHIYATTNTDLFMALGYVHAQDRLWQMELNRRTGHGQLAEVFGAIALSSDRFVRVLGLGRVARRELDVLDDETRSILEAYVQGINAFLSAHPRRLPVEFHVLRHRPRPWEVVDVLVWGKVVALDLSGNWKSELLHARIVATVGEARARELLLDNPTSQTLTVPAGISYRNDIGEGALHSAAEAAPFLKMPDAGVGSNAWVVDGTRSTTGRPLLANDPHLSLNLPSIWYEAHLCGGDYAVTGATFPGVPGVIIGHNDRIAWGVTNGMVDVQDLFIERFHPDDPLRYAWQDGWEQAELIREEIWVKGCSEPVVEEVRITRHGPVISAVVAPPGTPLAAPGVRQGDTGGDVQCKEELALRWTALDAGYVAQAILRLNRARHWDDFRSALTHFSAPPQNFVYADVDGHVGYTLSGAVPIRAQGDGRLPVPGWTGTYEWIGYIPFADLPAVYDPADGLIFNANNRTIGNEYALHDVFHGEWLNGYRAERIRTLLEATPQHDLQSFARIQGDLYSLPGLDLARLMADLPLTDSLEKQARDLLVAWDGILHADSAGGAIYSVLRYHLERLAYAELGDLRSALVGLGLFSMLPANKYLGLAFPGILARIASAQGAQREDVWLGAGHTWNTILQECMARTVADLRMHMGKNPRNWRYGRIHNLTLRHALGSIPILSPIFNRGVWPTGGDIDTVCMGYMPRDSGPRPLYTGPSYRQICDVQNWDASQSILSGGQSGHPGSRHYCDLTAIWHSGVYHPMLWSRSLVEQNTVSRLILEPAPHKAKRKAHSLYVQSAS